MAANRTKTLVDLTPGDYWIQIRAQSLAKLGNPSTKQYFTIYVNRSFFFFFFTLDPVVVEVEVKIEVKLDAIQEKERS